MTSLKFTMEALRKEPTKQGHNLDMIKPIQMLR